jgi:hypothetical protein
MAAVTTNGEGSAYPEPESEPEPETESEPQTASEAAADEAPRASAPEPEPEPEPEAPRASAAPHVCNVAFCPIGLAISTVQPLRPDAVEHLLVAGRELFLAMRTIVDARADQFDPQDTTSSFEKIDIG